MDKDKIIYGMHIDEIIPDKYNNLQIGVDIHDDYEGGDYINPDVEYLIPSILFTPNMKKTQKHFHIQLTRSQAVRLHRWLEEYLVNPNRGLKGYTTDNKE